jgi:ABC-2 type transport system permease protein
VFDVGREYGRLLSVSAGSPISEFVTKDTHMQDRAMDQPPADPSAVPETGEFPQIGVRRFGAVNWIGVWTLYKKEVSRFFKVAAQTIFAPMATTLLFLMVFTLALGQYRPDINGVPFGTFVAPGLIMMTILQNSFANASSSLIIGKVQGNIVDVLMPPLSPMELTFAYSIGAATRGVVCAIVTAIPMAVLLVDLTVTHLWALIVFGVGASLVLGLIGVVAGIWAEKFDHLATITNFVITPLSLLSGTFYPISVLAEPWQSAIAYNPFFYLIDGFRYGVTGNAEGNIAIGVAMVLSLIIILWLWAYWLFARGYRLKA